MSKRLDLRVANDMRDLTKDALSCYDIPSEVYTANVQIDADCVRLADDLIQWVRLSRRTSAKAESLRQRVARSLYGDGARIARPQWDDLPAERKRGWLSDADRVIPIVVKACALVAEQKDPDKPSNYLFPRERIGSVMEGLFVGMPSEEWECPIGVGDCTENCGRYGCKN